MARIGGAKPLNSSILAFQKLNASCPGGSASVTQEGALLALEQGASAPPLPLHILLLGFLSPWAEGPFSATLLSPQWPVDIREGPSVAPATLWFSCYAFSEEIMRTRP